MSRVLPMAVHWNVWYRRWDSENQFQCVGFCTFALVFVVGVVVACRYSQSGMLCIFTSIDFSAMKHSILYTYCRGRNVPYNRVFVCVCLFSSRCIALLNGCWRVASTSYLFIFFRLSLSFSLSLVRLHCILVMAVNDYKRLNWRNL